MAISRQLAETYPPPVTFRIFRAAGCQFADMLLLPKGMRVLVLGVLVMITVARAANLRSPVQEEPPKIAVFKKNCKEVFHGLFASGKTDDETRDYLLEDFEWKDLLPSEHYQGYWRDKHRLGKREMINRLAEYCSKDDIQYLLKTAAKYGRIKTLSALLEHDGIYTDGVDIERMAKMSKRIEDRLVMLKTLYATLSKMSTSGSCEVVTRSVIISARGPKNMEELCAAASDSSVNVTPDNAVEVAAAFKARLPTYGHYSKACRSEWNGEKMEKKHLPEALVVVASHDGSVKAFKDLFSKLRALSRTHVVWRHYKWTTVKGELPPSEYAKDLFKNNNLLPELLKFSDTSRVDTGAQIREAFRELVVDAPSCKELLDGMEVAARWPREFSQFEDLFYKPDGLTAPARLPDIILGGSGYGVFPTFTHFYATCGDEEGPDENEVKRWLDSIYFGGANPFENYEGLDGLQLFKIISSKRMAKHVLRHFGTFELRKQLSALIFDHIVGVHGGLSDLTPDSFRNMGLLKFVLAETDMEKLGIALCSTLSTPLQMPDGGSRSSSCLRQMSSEERTYMSEWAEMMARHKDHAAVLMESMPCAQNAAEPCSDTSIFAFVTSSLSKAGAFESTSVSQPQVYCGKSIFESLNRNQPDPPFGERLCADGIDIVCKNLIKSEKPRQPPRADNSNYQSLQRMTRDGVKNSGSYSEDLKEAAVAHLPWVVALLMQGGVKPLGEEAVSAVSSELQYWFNYALARAIAREEPNERIEKLINEHKASIKFRVGDDKEPILFMYKDLEQLKILIGAGPYGGEGEDAVASLRDKNKELLIHRAVRRGEDDVVEYLLERRLGNINGENTDNQTPLMLAALYGRTNIARMLIEKGARLDVESSKRERALEIAIRSSAKDIALMILDTGRAEPIIASLEAATQKAMPDVLVALAKAGARIEGVEEAHALLKEAIAVNSFDSFDALLRIAEEQELEVWENVDQSLSLLDRAVDTGNNLVLQVIARHVRSTDLCTVRKAMNRVYVKNGSRLTDAIGVLNPESVKLFLARCPGSIDTPVEVCVADDQKKNRNGAAICERSFGYYSSGRFIKVTPIMYAASLFEKKQDEEKEAAKSCFQTLFEGGAKVNGHSLSQELAEFETLFEGGAKVNGNSLSQELVDVMDNVRSTTPEEARRIVDSFLAAHPVSQHQPPKDTRVPPHLSELELLADPYNIRPL